MSCWFPSAPDGSFAYGPFGLLGSVIVMRDRSVARWSSARRVKRTLACFGLRDGWTAPGHLRDPLLCISVLWNGWTSPGRLRDPFLGEAHPLMYPCTCGPVLWNGQTAPGRLREPFLCVPVLWNGWTSLHISSSTSSDNSKFLAKSIIIDFRWAQS